jgi:predicted AlkP superfamily phosphohydrolase/phosphomutase
MADFNGNRVDPVNSRGPQARMGKEFLEKHNQKFLSLMAAAKIPQGLFYIVKQKRKLRLVDMRTSLNKMAGPGMIRDLFSKVIDTQEVIKVVTLTPDIITAIKNGKGSYTGDLILKTSAFKTITRGTKPNQRMYPVYAKVVR